MAQTLTTDQRSDAGTGTPLTMMPARGEGMMEHHFHQEGVSTREALKPAVLHPFRGEIEGWPSTDGNGRRPISTVRHPRDPGSEEFQDAPAHLIARDHTLSGSGSHIAVKRSYRPDAMPEGYTNPQGPDITPHRTTGDEHHVRTATVARGRGYRNFQSNDGRRPDAGLHATKDAGLPPQFDIEKKELGKRRENG